MHNEGESARGKCTSFAWGVLKISLFGMTPLLLYLMCYGFYLRTARAETLENVYRPAKWMLTDTLLQKPVLTWGEQCGTLDAMHSVIQETNSSWSDSFLNDPRAKEIEKSLGVEYH